MRIWTRKIALAVGLIAITLLSAAPFATAAGPKGDACNLIGCPDVGKLHCASTTIKVETPVGGVEASVTCYQSEAGTGDPRK